MNKNIKNSLTEAKEALESLISNSKELNNIENAAKLLISVISQKGKVYSCGNGGSMSDAMHFAEELSGRYRKDRRAIAAISISDPSHITCVANDYGYEYIFSRYIEAHSTSTDLVLCISTSGESINIINAAKSAKLIGAKVIALTGRQGSNLEEYADICICTKGGEFADRVQELHIKVIHILIELTERDLFPENYQVNL